jgi:hypothetical protein
MLTAMAADARMHSPDVLCPVVVLFDAYMFCSFVDLPD